jgi:CO/xanthine dehydrogenase FAD-binding subunit
MIVEYFRPKNVSETLELINEPKIKTVLVGGGTSLDRSSSEPFAVVDLQDAGLNSLQTMGKVLEIGATVTLQGLYESNEIQPDLKDSLYRECALNLRQIATVAGTLVTSNGRSPFTSAMLALDATLTLEPGDDSIYLGSLLPLREKKLGSRLISRISIPLNVQLAYEYIARTPADLPIVCAAVARWPSGRTRVILGGKGEAPVLAMDGPESGGEEISAEDAYSNAGDQWASAEYRQEMAQGLVKRCLAKLEK